MDRVYKEDIPAARQALERLNTEFAGIDTATDWRALRVRPLLKHVAALQRVLEAPRFSAESARLRRGVAMFRSDLVYLRHNIKELRALLAIETSRAARAGEAAKGKGRGGRSGVKRA